MISVKNLFINRLKNEWKFNFKLLKTSIDWVIALYLIIPLFLIGLYHYFSLWQGLYEIEYLTLYIIVYLALYLFTLTGDIRSFIDYGDQLFLRQRYDLLRELQNMGLIYTLISSFFTTVIVFSLIAPLLIVYLKLSVFEFIVLIFFVYIFHLIQMYLKQFIFLYFEGWKRIFILIFAIIISLFVYGFLIYNLNRLTELIILVVLTLIVLFYQLHSKKLTIKWSFNDDCIREHKQKIKYARYLLKLSSYFDGPVIKKKNKKKRPWLFRNSRTLFKKRSSLNCLVELYLKIILRNKGNLLALLQITSVFLYGIMITDNLVKLGVWIFYILTLLKYLKDTWYVNEQNQFLKFYPVKENLKIKAAQLSIFYISLPIILLISFITGYSLHSFYLGLVLMAIGVLVNYLVTKLLIKAQVTEGNF